MQQIIEEEIDTRSENAKSPMNKFSESQNIKLNQSMNLNKTMTSEQLKDMRRDTYIMSNNKGMLNRTVDLSSKKLNQSVINPSKESKKEGYELLNKSSKSKVGTGHATKRTPITKTK